MRKQGNYAQPTRKKTESNPKVNKTKLDRINFKQKQSLTENKYETYPPLR